VERLNRDYRDSGVLLPETAYAESAPRGTDFAGALIVGPPSAAGSGWVRRFGPASRAFASGWMRIRGARRRRSLDRGFVLSDHVDWPALLQAIDATGAERVWVSHGYREPVVRWLREHGLAAEAIASRWEAMELPFVLAHHPDPSEAGYVLAGHVHPAVRLVGKGRQRERLPCFWFGAEVGVFPAFGDFTGAAVVQPAAGDRVFVLASDRVMEIEI
jgi:hypothetical protein